MTKRAKIAVVDFSVGNLFSVQRACEIGGAEAVITASPEEVRAADGVILPGVGAFDAAMTALNASGLSDALRETVAEGKPVLGICLGLQLLMDESSEFGRHKGFGFIPGRVERLPEKDGAETIKVPHIGWNRVKQAAPGRFAGTPLEALRDGGHMYFVHSYFVVPEDPATVVSRTRYGGVEFASSLSRGNIFACQFHPERSGPEGLAIYRNWLSGVKETIIR